MSLIQKRKTEHLTIPLSENVEMHSSSGFEKYRLIHQALPEINFADIDTSTIFLGKKLSAPLIISSMTGGTEISQRINTNLASACQKTGIAMGVGSQRIALEKFRQDPQDARNAIEVTSFQVRKIAPDILLLGNLGAIQLNNGYSSQELNQAIDLIEADALFLHLNPLQEAVQPEGNTNFSGLTTQLAQNLKLVKKPVILKEVGNGLSHKSLKLLKSVGITIVDVAGSGGTSWGYIEAKRRGASHLAHTFRNWGIPAAESIQEAVSLGFTTIASGGIRNGVEMTKALALGAGACGIALPFLSLGAKDPQSVVNYIKELILELKIAMFAIGVKNIKELIGNKRVIEKLQS